MTGYRDAQWLPPCSTSLCMWLLRNGWKGSVMWKVFGHISSSGLTSSSSGLMSRPTRNAFEQLVKKGQYSDDIELLAMTHDAAEAAIRAYIYVTRALGFTVSMQKTKFVVVEYGVMEEEKMPIVSDEGQIE